MYPQKENQHKQQFVPYPISQVDGRWIYQQSPQYLYNHHSHHQRKFNQVGYDHSYFQQHLQNKIIKPSTASYSPGGNSWAPHYPYSPETPPVDYEFPYDRYRSSHTICNHIDKYGTQRGSKYTTRNQRKECKKCRNDSGDERLSHAYTKNIVLRDFDEKHPILGSPCVSKYPYNYRYSRSDEEIDDEWNSYWEKEEEEEEEGFNVLPLQKLFVESKEVKNSPISTKETSDKSIKSKSSYLSDPLPNATHNNSPKSITNLQSHYSVIEESVRSGQNVNTHPNAAPKRPQLATFASIKSDKASELETENIFPKTGIIIVEDDSRIGKKLQKELKPIRPFEEESTSSDSSTSSAEENSISRDTNNQNFNQTKDTTLTWSSAISSKATNSYVIFN